MHDRKRVFIPYGRRPEGGARVDLRMVAFFGIMLLLLALAGWLYLRQASEVAGLSSAIRELELDKEARHRELVTLRAEVAMLGSLKRVLNEGIEMGYRLPDAALGEGQLVLPCSVDCTAPERIGVTSGAPALDPAHGSAGAWTRLLERLANWIRPALPAW